MRSVATTCHIETRWTTLWRGCKLTGAGPHSVHTELPLPSTGSRCYHRCGTGGNSMRLAATLRVIAPWSATHCDITCWSTGIWEQHWQGMLLAHWRRHMEILDGRGFGGCWLLLSQNVPLTSCRRSMPRRLRAIESPLFPSATDDSDPCQEQTPSPDEPPRRRRRLHAQLEN